MVSLNFCFLPIDRGETVYYVLGDGEEEEKSCLYLTNNLEGPGSDQETGELSETSGLGVKKAVPEMRFWKVERKQDLEDFESIMDADMAPLEGIESTTSSALLY